MLYRIERTSCENKKDTSYINGFSSLNIFNSNFNLFYTAQI